MSGLFPLLYHAHHSLHKEDIPFWMELAALQGSPLLELGCGTGRVLLPLAQAGYLVYGMDNDAGMLAILRMNQAPALQPRVNVLIADLAGFHLQKRFALILLPCNTFSTLTPAQRQSMLTCVAWHLSPAGVFAASLPNPSLLKSLPAHAEPEVEEVFPHPLDGEPVQVSSAWKRTARHINLYWHYDHLLPDGRVERTSGKAQHSLVPAETYLEELRREGFVDVQLYGDFDGSDYTPNAPNLIVVAKSRLHS